MNRICSVLVVFVSVLMVFAEVGPRHLEKAGGFSFCAPEGWDFREFPGMKFKIAFGTPADNFCPNINVVDEASAVELKSYVDNNIAGMEKMFQEFKLISRKKLTAGKKLEGEVVVTNALQQGNLLRQTFFFFKGKGGRFFVATCSCLEKDGDRFAPVFEESLKTFAVR